MNHPRQRAQRVMLLAIILLAFMAINGFIGWMIYKEYQNQQIFRQLYGDGWQKDYEQKNGAGSVDRAHTEIIIGFATMPVTGILLLLIYLQATADRSGGYSLQNRKKFKEPKKEW